MHSIKLHHQLTLPHFREEQPPRCADWKRVKSLLNLMAMSGYQLVNLKIVVVQKSLAVRIVQAHTLSDQRLAEHLGQAEILKVRREIIGRQQETFAQHDVHTIRAKEGTGTATILGTW